MKTITTQKVNCQDCHRCVRSCPVKAIAIKQGHAQLITDKCVLCGKCVIECPQHAKQVENQTDLVKAAIQSGRRVVMSIAPSFISALSDMSVAELYGAIQGLGFSAIEETAIGAEVVANFYHSQVERSKQTVISACCPAIVRLIAKYYPNLTDNLAPVVSPMLAHGRMLKARYGKDCFVVFAGPCIAKIAEADDDVAVDAVLTFTQLRAWLASQVNQHASDNETVVTAGSEAFSRARLFPIAGGILQSAFVEEGNEDIDIISVDGLRQCMLVFDSLASGEIQPRFIEALACIGGCVNGPASSSPQSLPFKRRRVTQYAMRGNSRPNPIDNLLSFDCHHNATPISRALPTEDEIREILRSGGKHSKQDEKNCGACGYNTCRDNAIAVFQGLTEIDTCVPYMRSKAESSANIVVDNSLNAIILLDEKLVVQDFNPAAVRMFNRLHELAKGLRLTEIMDCADIFSAIENCRKVSGQRVEFPEVSLITERMIVPVPEHRLVFLIFSDVTEHERRNRELEHMKLETVDKAKEIINKQMHVAQEIAGLLGETTAQTKSALLELIAIMREKEGR